MQEGNRKDQFKKTSDLNSSRRRREELSLNTRRIKREENLRKKRSITGGGDDDEEILQWMSQLPLLREQLYSPDQQNQYNSVHIFRKLLSIEKDPPIQHVIDLGIVPKFVELLKSNNPQIVFEACWALTNVASGTPEQTKIVVENDATPILIQLLRHPDENVREQSIWALGNIAGECVEFRDYVLGFEAVVPSIIDNLKSQKIDLLRYASWTISNLCRGKPQPDWNIVSKFLYPLAHLLTSTDPEVLQDVCWSFSYLSDGPNERIEEVIETGISKKIVELLQNKSHKVQTAALRIVGNIVTGTDEQTQIILNVNVLPYLLQLLHSERKALCKEACWAISNICAGNRKQVQAIIGADIFPRLIDLMGDDQLQEIRREAAWAISNACSGGSPLQIKYIVSKGAIKAFCGLLDSTDYKTLIVALEGLENILRSGHEETREINEPSKYAREVERHKGLLKIEALQAVDNNDIYEKVVKILENYFPYETVDDEPTQTHGQFNLDLPNTGQTFKFN